MNNKKIKIKKKRQKKEAHDLMAEPVLKEK
jgi:hypothetical protein